MNLGVLGKPKTETLSKFGNQGLLREQQRWTEYWRSFELQLPLATREKIMKTAMLLQRKVDRGKLQEKRAKEYHHILLKIGILSSGNMDNPSFVEGVLKGNFGPSQRYLQTAMTAYNYYQYGNKIKGELDI